MNYLATNKDLKARVAYLKTLKSALVGTGKPSAVKAVIREEKARISKEIEFLNSNKSWNYNFESGGWNSGHGKTVEDLLKKENKRWGKNPHSPIKESSIRIATEEDTNRLLSLFH